MYEVVMNYGKYQEKILAVGFETRKAAEDAIASGQYDSHLNRDPNRTLFARRSSLLRALGVK